MLTDDCSSTRNVKDSELGSYLMKNATKFEYGTLVDDRDGEIYCTVRIGNQMWMAENLRYVSVGGVADDDKDSFVYGEVESNVDRYGRLYTWDAALKVAPEGWHLPSDEEWGVLCDYLASMGDELPGNALKASSFWEEKYGVSMGTDSSGFAAVPAGGRYSMGYFHDANRHAYFWTSDSEGREYAKYRCLCCRGGQVSCDYSYRSDAFSVRCVRDI
ncbi:MULTISPECIES: FISUMP domain-containing protein [unclassified Fibrobacter]|uniref:FISUMP domain-containing protein n=1 Tax=unclassified Fibrobacter TaxID=2634177 RepID=UPI000D6D0A9C|nr:MULTISPECIES: FISUMP domain-containing protein [unclassified Fibrobacter]PWJ61260.1 uncharacterized protein (TIGR02145 family) [Fibrobacter sp. UWR4]PZW66099.1 uncharacterized protein (TIGR02145 family) [Fibrobacter sp. UWR1]